MGSTVLVTGGTGTLGRRVAPRLVDAGCDVRVLTRQQRASADGVEFYTGDLANGAGVQSAVNGVSAVVHCAGGRKGDDVMTRTLVQAMARAGSPHLVFVSVVGADRVQSFAYFRSKQAAELVVTTSGLPWTTLRATQFYDLLWKGAHALGKLPVVPAVAGFRCQPVDSDEVAARLVELALGEPAGLVAEFGGPKVWGFADLLRSYLETAHIRRPVVSVWMPGIGPVRAGALLVKEAEGAPMGRRTWEEFLTEKSG